MIGCARCHHHWRHHRDPGGHGACGVTTVTNTDGRLATVCDCPAWVVPSNSPTITPPGTGEQVQHSKRKK